jgi:hypothetical protein
VVTSQIAHLLESVAVVPEFQPDHLQALQLDRGDFRAVLYCHALTDLEFIVIKTSLQMSEAAMKKRCQGPEHFFNVVFQLAVVEQADGGVKERRHGKLDLIWLGQWAMIGFTWSRFCAMKGDWAASP